MCTWGNYNFAWQWSGRLKFRLYQGQNRLLTYISGSASYPSWSWVFSELSTL